MPYILGNGAIAAPPEEPMLKRTGATNVTKTIISLMIAAILLFFIGALYHADGPEPVKTFLLLIGIAAGLIQLYFLPTLVAYRRLHRNQYAIFILNLALGWTFLGWVFALIWANTADTEPRCSPL